MKNYSRQREAILSVLRSTASHPTARSVYEQVKLIIPNISLGTVYRNLTELRDSGEILSLSVGDGNEHFDGDNTLHAHLYCSKCGRIYDACIAQSFIDEIGKKNGFMPLGTSLVIQGVCKTCNKNYFLEE